MLGDGAGPRRLLPTQSVSGHVFRDRLHLGFRSDALEPSPRALLGLVHEQLQLLFFTFPKFALGSELVAGIPLVFAGVGEDRERGRNPVVSATPASRGPRKPARYNRDRGKSRDSSPPTPPDVRVRIRRFGGLSRPRHRDGSQAKGPQGASG